MEEILLRIQTLENELKKEREINRTLQFQIADMNEEITEFKNSKDNNIILQNIVDIKQILEKNSLFQLQIINMNEEINQLKKAKDDNKNILQNIIDIKKSINNNIDYEKISKNHYVDMLIDNLKQYITYIPLIYENLDENNLIISSVVQTEIHVHRNEINNKIRQIYKNILYLMEKNIYNIDKSYFDIFIQFCKKNNIDKPEVIDAYGIKNYNMQSLQHYILDNINQTFYDIFTKFKAIPSHNFRNTGKFEPNFS